MAYVRSARTAGTYGPYVRLMWMDSRIYGPYVQPYVRAVRTAVKNDQRVACTARMCGSPVRTGRTWGPYVRSARTAGTYGPYVRLMWMDSRMYGPYVRLSKMTDGSHVRPVRTAAPSGLSVPAGRTYGTRVRAVRTANADKPTSVRAVRTADPSGLAVRTGRKAKKHCA